MYVCSARGNICPVEILYSVNHSGWQGLVHLINTLINLDSYDFSYICIPIIF